MSADVTPQVGKPDEPYSKVVIDLNDPDQLAAVSEYYLITFGPDASPKMAEAQRMRVALIAFAHRFGVLNVPRNLAENPAEDLAGDSGVVAHTKADRVIIGVLVVLFLAFFLMAVL